MKAIVTGGAGFIGSHIAEALLAAGLQVIVIDDLSAGKAENIPDGVEFLQRSVLDLNDCKHALKGADVVFHNAASKKNICLTYPARDMEVNGIGTLNLLLACKEAGVKKFIHASTGSVYGEVEGVIDENTPTNPVSYYGVSKLAGEKYVMLFAKEMDVVVLRYFHVYGERQEDDPNLGGVVAVFKRQIKDGKPLTIHGDGSQKRVFTHVEDVVSANMLAFHHASRVGGNIYNCASSHQVSIMALAGKLIRDAKKPVTCLLYTSPSPRDRTRSRMPSSA